MSELTKEQQKELELIMMRLKEDSIQMRLDYEDGFRT